MQSQQWIFTSPGGENEYKKPSLTREHYDAVIEIKTREKSIETESERKKRMLESFMWEKMTERTLEQIRKQRERFNEVQKARSTYDESYAKRGFVLKELGAEIDEELRLKYPLYTDTAKSIYLREIHKIKSKDAVHKPLSSMFRRDSRFTSRLNNPMDIHAPVEPGHFAYV